MSVDDDLARLVAIASSDLDGIVERVIPIVRPDITGPVPGRGLPDKEVARALCAVLDEIVRVLGGEIDYSAETLDEVIHLRFEQGVALLDLLRNYRVGAAAIWEQLYQLISDDRGASRALLVATPRVFDVIDRFSIRANEIYRERLIGSARRREQIRATLLDILLGGDPEQGASYWEAATALEIPRRGHFLVLDASVPSTVATETDWEKVVSGFPDVESAWFRLGPRSQIGLLALRSERVDAGPLGRALVDRSAATVGLSAPFTSLAGCRKGRAQAGIASAATSPERPVVQYDRDVLDVLMASSPDAAESLVEATLGRVLALPPDRAVVLIDNVRAWLNNQQSVAATASVMHCHRNTVNYRLRRFEEVSGRSLADNTWLAQVYLAVSYLPTSESVRLSADTPGG